MSYSYRSTRTPSSNNRYGRTKPNHKRKTGNKYGQYIDPKRFVASATILDAEVYVPRHAFKDFALLELLKNNLARKGYTTPSPIQDQAIPEGLNGKDVIGIAGTGTGKTAAFALPILNKLLTDLSSKALIIAPTRELAQQIEEEFQALAKGSNISSVLLIGGTGMSSQLRNLRYSPRIVIGTPGRIKDHIQRNTLKLSKFNMVVLDEVDRMLDMGFINDVQTILSHTDSNRQSYFFSATMDAKVNKIIEEFTKDSVTISVKASSASENVHQDVVIFRGNIDKIDRLHDLLLKEEVAKAIVFDETQRSVERLNKELVERGFTAEAIHGGKSQGQRQRALAKFKKNEVNILVATDVAARGIDVIDVTHVINYSVPKVYDDYIHRIGRAGRAGKVGYALTFVAHSN
jgi:ATP-dependent RNA helicase RhlE